MSSSSFYISIFFLLQAIVFGSNGYAQNSGIVTYSVTYKSKAEGTNEKTLQEYFGKQFEAAKEKANRIRYYVLFTKLSSVKYYSDQLFTDTIDLLNSLEDFVFIPKKSPNAFHFYKEFCRHYRETLPIAHSVIVKMNQQKKIDGILCQKYQTIVEGDTVIFYATQNLPMLAGIRTFKGFSSCIMQYSDKEKTIVFSRYDKGKNINYESLLHDIPLKERNSLRQEWVTSNIPSLNVGNNFIDIKFRSLKNEKYDISYFAHTPKTIFYFLEPVVCHSTLGTNANSEYYFIKQELETLNSVATNHPEVKIVLFSLENKEFLETEYPDIKNLSKSIVVVPNAEKWAESNGLISFPTILLLNESLTIKKRIDGMELLEQDDPSSYIEKQLLNISN